MHPAWLSSSADPSPAAAWPDRRPPGSTHPQV